MSKYDIYVTMKYIFDKSPIKRVAAFIGRCNFSVFLVRVVKSITFRNQQINEIFNNKFYIMRAIASFPVLLSDHCALRQIIHHNYVKQLLELVDDSQSDST